MRSQVRLFDLSGIYRMTGAVDARPPTEAIGLKSRW